MTTRFEKPSLLFHSELFLIVFSYRKYYYMVSEVFIVYLVHTLKKIFKGQHKARH